MINAFFDRKVYVICGMAFSESFKAGHTPNGRSTRYDWFSSLCVVIQSIILLYVLNMQCNTMRAF